MFSFCVSLSMLQLCVCVCECKCACVCVSVCVWVYVCVCLRCKERRILIRLLSIFNDLFAIPFPLSSKHNQAKTKKIKILSPVFCFYISPFGDVKRIVFCPFFCLCVREWWWLWYLSPKRIKVLLSTQQLHSHADRNDSSPTNNDILDMSLLHWQKKFIFEKFD